MKQITGLLANKRIVGSMLLLGGVLFFTYSIQENSLRLKRITNLESGIQTCFSRVNQTYTAKLLNDQASQYLTQNFQSLTEECFAEGILNVEENLKIELPILAKKLSTLASNVHWFHEDSLLPTTSTKSLTTNEEGRNIGTRFETIESTKDEVLDVSEQFKSSLSNDLSRDKNLFFGVSFLLVIALVLEYLANAKRKIFNLAREKEASEELLDSDGIESVKVGEIITVALEQNELVNCAKLFNNFYSSRLEVNTFSGKSKEAFALENLVTPNHFIKTNSEPIDEQIDKIWNNDGLGMTVDQVVPKTEEFNLNQVSARAVDLLAEKIFSLGIQLKVVIAEQITIKGREEELEQVFYHLLASAINFSATSQISMMAQRLGDIVIFDLKFQSNGVNDLVNGIDMKICQTLLEEMNVKIRLDNTLDQMGNVTGTVIKVIFIAGQDLSKTKHESVSTAKTLVGRDLISEYF